MKIAVLGTRGFPNIQGGVERHCQELYPRLVRLGCNVTVFTRTPYLPEKERLADWKGVNLIPLWCPKKKSSETLAHTLLGSFRTKILSPDILHIHAVGPALLVPLLKALGLKIVMTHHGPDYERAKWGKIAKLVLRQGEKFGVLNSDGLITISQVVKAFIQRKYGKDAIFIPNGVNIPSFIPSGNELTRWQLEPRNYIFTACRFVPEKGLHDLIAAYRRIENPPFRLVIAGDADHETDYSRRLKKCASETKGVILTGFITGERLGELFSNAGLFVLPSYYEGLPIVLLEALSYGLPVLVSDIPQHREIPLSDFRYFTAGNITMLYEALKETFSKGISEAEKERYLALLKESYSWDTIAAKTFEIYRRVAEGEVV